MSARNYSHWKHDVIFTKKYVSECKWLDPLFKQSHEALREKCEKLEQELEELKQRIQNNTV